MLFFEIPVATSIHEDVTCLGQNLVSNLELGNDDIRLMHRSLRNKKSRNF